MQHEITAPQKLLDENGNIKEPGYAKKLLWQYDRKDIKANKSRIKEWDYYYIGNDSYGIALTLSDVGYVSCLSISTMTFGDKPEQMNDSEIGLFPLGKLNMPNTSVKGDIHAKVGTTDMTFTNDGETRHLFGTYDNFCNTKKCLVFDFTLTEFPEETMVIATPFDKDKHFYYNQKINCMRADGFFEFDGTKYEFSRENNSLATLDWGRGVWVYNNVWYWGSGQCVLPSGDLFGFNIGYGFGNTSQASENMLFYNGKAHKLEDVTFNIPMNGKKYEYTKPWTFTSSDGRFEMNFDPIMDRTTSIDVGVMCMVPHQVFGHLSGKAILDDGKVIEVNNITTFAERVHNKW